MKFRVGAVLCYIYIFGILGVLTGTLSAFLFEPRSDAGIDGPWSSWSLVNSTLCFQIRNRTCVTDGCKKEEFKQCSDTKPTTVATQDTEWSQWTIFRETDFQCLVHRTRHCYDQGCEKEQIQLCIETAQWSEWSPIRCDYQNQYCFIARTRTCSDPKIDKCFSQESNQDIYVWGDSETCPCGTGDNPDQSQGEGQWEEWAHWKCHQNAQHCYIYRTRECSIPNHINCPSDERSQIKLLQDTCPCTSDSNSSTLFTTVLPGTSNGTWELWSPWTCQHVNEGCMTLRNRQCSTKRQRDCSGEHYELNLSSCSDCTQSTHATTSGPTHEAVYWRGWSEWECHRENRPCMQYRHRDCSSGSDTDCTTMSDGQPYQLIECIGTCAETPTTKPSQIVTPTTSVSASSTTKSTVTPTMGASISVTIPLNTPSTNAPSTAIPSPIYWLEWSDWNCTQPQQNVYLKARLRGCSTHLNEDCEHKLGGDNYVLIQDKVGDICPGLWSNWGRWYCRMGDHGICTMRRTRRCSTGSDEDCGSNSTMIQSCDETICPDKVKLEKSGQCKDYVSTGSMCPKASPTCSIIHSVFEPICTAVPHLAYRDCTKECGCCEEEPFWKEWSDWVCINQQSGKCEMKRRRKCSVEDECKGNSAQVAECSSQFCNDNVTATWSAWGDWKCEVKPDKSCVMSKFRNCSLDEPSDCDGDAVDTEKCKAETCIGTPIWTEWSAWSCKLAPNRTCKMTKQRTCSTGSNDKCYGESNAVTSCSKKVCQWVIDAAASQNCSLYDTKKSVCKDMGHCPQFDKETLLDLLCKEMVAAAECPVTCGCCDPLMIPSTTIATGITSNATIHISTTSATNNNTGNNENTTVSNTHTSDTVTPSTISSNNSNITPISSVSAPLQTTTNQSETPATMTKTTSSTTPITPSTTLTTHTTPLSTETTQATPTTKQTTPSTTQTMSSTTQATHSTSQTTPATTITAETTPSTTQTTPSTLQTTPATTKTTETTPSATQTTPSTTKTTETTPSATQTTPSTLQTTPATTKTAETTPSTTQTTPSTTKTTEITSSTTSTTQTTPTTVTQTSTIATTTVATSKPTTVKQPVTNPPIPVTCKVCAGPDFLCEKLYMDKVCNPPENYCINKLSNHKDGNRMVTRHCGTFDTCYTDWFLGSSDSDKCRKFDGNNIITLDFDCTYCCVNDNCNLPIRPSDASLYKDV